MGESLPTQRSPKTMHVKGAYHHSQAPLDAPPRAAELCSLCCRILGGHARGARTRIWRENAAHDPCDDMEKISLSLPVSPLSQMPGGRRTIHVLAINNALQTCMAPFQGLATSRPADGSTQSSAEPRLRNDQPAGASVQSLTAATLAGGGGGGGGGGRGGGDHGSSAWLHTREIMAAHPGDHGS